MISSGNGKLLIPASSGIAETVQAAGAERQARRGQVLLMHLPPKGRERIHTV